MNKVHLIDNMEFMKDIPDNHYELAIVDPPYGIERFKHGGSVVNRYGNERGEWNNTKPSNKYFEELFRMSVNQIIWGANNFYLPPSEYFIVWDKINPESFSFSMCEQAWTNVKKPAKIFRFNSINESKSRIHPTQKPVALYKWLLKNYAKPGNKIFDSHVGSGSIRIACHDLGFDFEGCEIDEDYYKAQEQRYKNHIAQADLFGSDEIQGLVYGVDKQLE